jgi:GMP synthase (glutamine-hydrolysing)
MSHGDQVEVLPPGFKASARSLSCPHAAMRDEARKFFALQFHPEVVHTQHGKEILHNFLFSVCERRRLEALLVGGRNRGETETAGRRRTVVLGLSGGVDSSVVAVLLHRAIGDRLHCIFVDNAAAPRRRQTGGGDVPRQTRHGPARHRRQSALLRRAQRRRRPGEKTQDHRPRIHRGLRGTGPHLQELQVLGQGTIYPDVIESVSPLKGPSQTIKSHHNVGGLPPDLTFELVEPLRELFKDEVRAVGRVLGMADELLDRQPFPGRDSAYASSAKSPPSA